MPKTAVISGATGDLGAAICRRLAAEGFCLRLCARRPAAAEQLLSTLPEGCSATILDLLDSAAINRWALQLTAELTDGLDLLVNCVGMTKFIEHRQLESLEDDFIDQIFQVNVRAPLALIRAFSPLLQRGRGTIINITSVAAQLAEGSNIAYCASKAALANVTASLARALAPEVRVLAVAPGLVDTGFIKELSSEWRAKQLHQTPLQRLVNPAEVADAVWMASQLSGATGTTIEVDGGRTLGC